VSATAQHVTATRNPDPFAHAAPRAPHRRRCDCRRRYCCCRLRAAPRPPPPCRRSRFCWCRSRVAPRTPPPTQRPLPPAFFVAYCCAWRPAPPPPVFVAVVIGVLFYACCAWRCAPPSASCHGSRRKRFCCRRSRVASRPPPLCRRSSCHRRSFCCQLRVARRPFLPPSPRPLPPAFLLLPVARGATPRYPL